MKIITCNFQGRKHSERNEPCEDSVYYLQSSGVTTVAVADGAGSKKYDHAKDGADAVTKAICNFFEAKFDDFFESSNELELRSVVQTICHKALRERAKELELDSIETMASTLLVVSVKGNKLISVQIGDGLIGRLFHDELETVTMPQNGEYASSTYFINDPEAFKMVQVRKMFLTGTTHLFLMSDGVADCMFNDFNGEFNTSLKALLETAEEPNGEEKVKKAIKEFIVDADPMSDDCTMAVICFNEKLVSIEADAPQQEAVAQPAAGGVPADSAVPAAFAAYQTDVQPNATEADQELLLKEKKPIAKWKVIAVVVAAVVIIVSVVLAVVFWPKDDDSKGKRDNDDKDSISISVSTDDNGANNPYADGGNGVGEYATKPTPPEATPEAPTEAPTTD